MAILALNEDSRFGRPNRDGCKIRGEVFLPEIHLDIVNGKVCYVVSISIIGNNKGRRRGRRERRRNRRLLGTYQGKEIIMKSKCFVCYINRFRFIVVIIVIVITTIILKTLNLTSQSHSRYHLHHQQIIIAITAVGTAVFELPTFSIQRIKKKIKRNGLDTEVVSLLRSLSLLNCFVEEKKKKMKQKSVKFDSPMSDEKGENEKRDIQCTK